MEWIDWLIEFSQLVEFVLV